VTAYEIILRFSTVILSARGALGAQNVCARLARANHTILHSRHDPSQQQIYVRNGAKEGHGWDVGGIWTNRRIITYSAYGLKMISRTRMGQETINDSS